MPDLRKSIPGMNQALVRCLIRGFVPEEPEVPDHLVMELSVGWPVAIEQKEGVDEKRQIC